MDRPIEKKSFPRRYIGYIAAAVAVVALLVWIVFGSTASTMTIDSNDVTVSDVTRGKFRMNGKYLWGWSGISLKSVGTDFGTLEEENDNE